MKMTFKNILAAAALLIPMAASAQADQWNVQYMKQRNYGSPSANNPIRIDIPDLDGYKTIKADLHIHTYLSDGDVKPSVRVEEAWMNGLDAIAITDHQPIFGAKENHDYDAPYNQAVATAEKRGITLIRGLEISHSDNAIGHINLLFVKSCNNYQLSQQFDQQETHDALVKAKAEGAFITGNHPGWPDEDSELSQFWLDEIAAGRIMGMEIFNSYEFYPLAIDHVKNYNLTPIGASDVHRPIPYEYGRERTFRPMTLIFARSNSQEDIKEALMARRTLAMANGMVCGSKEWLLKLLRASLELEVVEPRGNKTRIRIYNNSDISYFLDCGIHTKEILIPAHRYFDGEVNNMDFSLSFKVTNMMIGSTEYLQIPLSYITTFQSDIDMPMVDQKAITYGADGSVIIPMITEKGQTYYTTDGSEPSASNGKLYSGSITVNSGCTIKARTFNGDKSSFTYSYPLTYLKATKAKPKKKGLSYTYYADPEPRSIISVKNLTPERMKAAGTTDKPQLLDREEEDWFGYIFEGWINIPVSGIYTFMLDTDDGSQLIIDGETIVDIDFNLGNSVATGYVYLEAGYHDFKFPYFEGHYSEKIEFSWIKPGASEFEPVPATVYFQK